MTTPKHAAIQKKLESMRNDEIIPRDYWGHEARPPWYRVRKMTADQMVSILEGVANGGSVQKVAQENGTSLWAVQRQRIADEGFGLAMNDALELRRMAFEEKAVELAMDGEVEEYEKGGKTFTRKTYPNNSLLQRLLSAYYPDTYGTQRQEVREGPLETPPEVVRNPEDRQKMVDNITSRRYKQLPATGPVYEAEAEGVDEDEEQLLDLL